MKGAGAETRARWSQLGQSVLAAWAGLWIYYQILWSNHYFVFPASSLPRISPVLLYIYCASPLIIGSGIITIAGSLFSALHPFSSPHALSAAVLPVCISAVAYTSAVIMSASLNSVENRLPYQAALSAWTRPSVAVGVLVASVASVGLFQAAVIWVRRPPPN